MKHKKVLFTTLLTQGKLYQHCAEIEKQAQDMFDTLVKQMKESEGVTEQLKEENQLEWVCCMQNIDARAREVVTTELIYVNSQSKFHSSTPVDFTLRNKWK